MPSQMQSLVTVVVAGRPLGVFDTRSGGEVTAEVTKRRKGGMPGTETAYPNLPTYGDVTVAKDSDDQEQLRWLRTVVGKAEMSITDQPLGLDGAPWGRPTVYNGLLSGVNGGDVDSTSAEPRLVELTCSVTGVS